MPALIGYLVAIVVFLGGGYAGVQWLTSPEEIPSAVAIQRSSQPVKSTRARLLARKKHEAAAEREANARPTAGEAVSQQAAAPAAPDAPPTETAMAQRNESVSVNEPSPESAPPSNKVADSAIPSAAAPTPVSTVAHPAASKTEATPASQTSEVTATAASASTVALRADNSASSEVPADTARTPQAIERPARQLALRSLSSAEKQVVRSAVAKDAAGVADRKSSAAKKRRDTARLASTSRKPVLMILRTIEYPDGRREQRLLPMPRAHQAYAYAD